MTDRYYSYPADHWLDDEGFWHRTGHLLRYLGHDEKRNSQIYTQTCPACFEQWRSRQITAVGGFSAELEFIPCL